MARGSVDIDVGHFYHSQYLSCPDLHGQDVTITIESVTRDNIYNREKREFVERLVIWSKELEWGYVVNKTMGRFLARLLGERSGTWADKRITLYPGSYNGKPSIMVREQLPAPAAAAKRQVDQATGEITSPPPAKTPAAVAAPAAPAQASGNGKPAASGKVPARPQQKLADIRTAAWRGKAGQLGTRIPRYQTKDGAIDFPHMSAAALHLGYGQITDANLAEVLVALEQHALEADARDAAAKALQASAPAQGG